MKSFERYSHTKRDFSLAVHVHNKKEEGIQMGIYSNDLTSSEPYINRVFVYGTLMKGFGIINGFG